MTAGAGRFAAGHIAVRRPIEDRGAVCLAFAQTLAICPMRRRAQAGVHVRPRAFITWRFSVVTRRLPVPAETPYRTHGLDGQGPEPPVFLCRLDVGSDAASDLCGYTSSAALRVAAFLPMGLVGDNDGRERDTALAGSI